MSRDLIMVAVGILPGLALGWFLWRQPTPPPETHAEEVHLPSGAVALEREPEAPVPVPLKQAVRELDRKATLERAVRVTVVPKTPVTSTEPCPPVNLDIGLVKLPDQTRRVVVHSSDGDVLGGVDIPIQATERVQALKWAAGALYVPHEESYGIFLDRDIGRLRVGAELVQSREHGVSGIVRLGIRF